MKIIVGLGNPGDRYKLNRHNSGFLFLDYCQTFFKEKATPPSSGSGSFNLNLKLNSEIATIEQPPQKYLLVKPQTFMNDSGMAVAKTVNFYQLNPEKDLVVIHDDLDLAFGQFKIDFDKGPKAHNGLNSIIGSLKTSRLLRLRLGIKNEIYSELKKSQASIADEFVLKDFSNLEKAQLPAIYEKAVKELFSKF